MAATASATTVAKGVPKGRPTLRAWPYLGTANYESFSLVPGLHKSVVHGLSLYQERIRLFASPGRFGRVRIGSYGYGWIAASSCVGVPTSLATPLATAVAVAVAANYGHGLKLM